MGRPESWGVSAATGSIWVDRQMSYSMDTPKVPALPLGLLENGCPAGTTFPRLLWVGPCDSFSPMEETKRCVCHFQTGVVKSWGWSSGLGEGPAPIDCAPILAQRGREGKEAQTNDEEMVGAE